MTERYSPCMQGNSTCAVCGHTYDVHMHAYFLNKLEEVETVVINEDMKRAFEKAVIDIETLGQDMKNGWVLNSTRLKKKYQIILETLKIK